MVDRSVGTSRAGCRRHHPAASVAARRGEVRRTGRLAGGAGVETLSFEYGPEGSASGRIKYTGECIMTSYEVSAAVGDAVQASADFQVTGAITRGTWS